MTCSRCGETGSGRYCTVCGTEVLAPGLRSEGVAWWISGVLLTALLFVTILPLLDQTAGTVEEAPTGVGQGHVSMDAVGSVATTDLSTMTPREAADRLFLRVMRAAASNERNELQGFLPMALSAYGLVDVLDAQGSFRLALLQRLAGMDDKAFSTLSDGLAIDPGHLLLLGGATELAISFGDSTRAREFAERLLSGFEGERGRDLPEYRDNDDVLMNLRTRAEALLATDDRDD